MNEKTIESVLKDVFEVFELTDSYGFVAGGLPRDLLMDTPEKVSDIDLYLRPSGYKKLQTNLNAIREVKHVEIVPHNTENKYKHPRITSVFDLKVEGISLPINVIVIGYHGRDFINVLDVLDEMFDINLCKCYISPSMPHIVTHPLCDSDLEHKTATVRIRNPENVGWSVHRCFTHHLPKILKKHPHLTPRITYGD